MLNDTPGLGTLLRRAMAALDGGAQQVYDERGVRFRPRYFAIARHLLNHGPTAVSQLAARLAMTQPAISQTLREMENVGLISLEPGEDRRVHRAGLSDQGLVLCQQLEPIWEAVASAAEELNAEVGADLADVLQRLVAALDRHPFALRIEEKLS